MAPNIPLTRFEPERLLYPVLLPGSTGGVSYSEWYTIRR